MHPYPTEALIRVRQEDLRRSLSRFHRRHRETVAAPRQKVFAPPAPRGRVCGYPFGHGGPALPAER
jgi:hypothetical protein